MFTQRIASHIPIICVALLLALPVTVVSQEAEINPDSPMTVAVEQLIAAQDAWHTEHGEYATTEELKGLVKGNLLEGHIYPPDGGLIIQYLALDRQAYVLVGRDLKRHEFVTVSNGGYLLKDWSSQIEHSAYGALVSLASAQNDLFAQEMHYGSITELQAAGLLGTGWTPMLVKADGEGEVAVLETGAVITLALNTVPHSYLITADGGMYQYEQRSYEQRILKTRYRPDYELFLKEKALNSARVMVSANAAHYAKYGSYNELLPLTTRGFLDDRFGYSGLVDIGDGIRAYIEVRDDGQAYDAVTIVLNVMYLADESGEIREYALDQLVTEPEVELLRRRVVELHN